MSSSTAYFMGSELQVLCGNGEEKLLLLAEGLLKKHVASHSLHEPEGTFLFPSLFLCRQPGEQLMFSFTYDIQFYICAALIVYFSILEQQAKYGDALEILAGKLGSLLMIEVDKLRIQVLSEAYTSY